ncbi:CD1375 family protein [Peptoniphilus grossensis]|uniref:CD1375 family protein n=1 Tax=Peptoniphilus grossensis TaxID=1465756 RepID=UPI00031CD0EE|nr:CD1375 family protein [Peptoniphilus grossensis]
MIDLYVGLVKNGKRTCDVNNKKVRQVPKHLREAVIAELKAQGYDENGKEIK